MNNHIGIVGSTSPIGICIAKSLSNDFYLKLSYRDKNLVSSDFFNKNNIKNVYFDLQSPTFFDKNIFQKCQTIVWVAHIMQSYDKEEEIQLNVKAVQSFLKLLPETAVRKIVYISSGGSIYGNPSTIPIPESHSLYPLSSYGKAKKAVEETLIKFHEQTKIEIAILRPGNIYGSEFFTGRSKGIVATYINCIQNQKPFTIIGNSDAIRDYLHIDDLTQAVKCAIDSKKNRILWNVGTETGYSVSYIINLISNIFEKQAFQIGQRTVNWPEIHVNVLSNKMIKKESDWTVTIPLETGIRRIAEHYK
ncbi:NAD-dependent epimerase/dehydratase [Candidatus Magnetomorum sp. HK-1]|nr:NAD-dependent epimerase/dehydratase [Candidatus Magnetomorum sp. HK-1]